MDKEKLIEMVFAAQAIWNKRHRHHHNRYVLAGEWKKIAAKLKVAVKDAKNTWKNLRQEFGKQMKKSEGKFRDEASEETASSWPFFEKLQFLKDQFTPRQPSGNSDPFQNTEGMTEHSVEAMVDFSDHSEEDTSPHTRHTPIPPTDDSQHVDTPQPSSPLHFEANDMFSRTGYRKRLNLQTEIGKQWIHLEREKLELAKRKKSSSDANDDDVAFFNSLIPTVKLLPLKQKWQFRLRVQQLLYEFSFPENTPQPS